AGAAVQLRPRTFGWSASHERALVAGDRAGHHRCGAHREGDLGWALRQRTRFGYWLHATIGPAAVVSMSAGRPVDRHFWVDIRRVARAVLSEGRCEEALARLVRDTVFDN